MSATTRSSDTDPEELVTPKKVTRSSARKRQRPPSSDDESGESSSNPANADSGVESAVTVNKRISKCVQEIQLLSDKSVKKIIKKVVLNHHVLALVKLQEEEEEAKNVELPLKLTRSKARNLNKDVLPIPLNLSACDSETSRLIAADLNSESDDEEYNPENDDDLNNTLSDLDSQPRTPATPVKSKDLPSLSATPLSESVFKVPKARLDSTSQSEQEIIAQRTRSKLCLQKTPIETIESTFVPPDITKDMYEFDKDMDDTWKEFLDEFMRPMKSAPENEDDEADPEYAVAVDRAPSRNEFNPIGEIPLTELNDLVQELLDQFIIDEEEGQPDAKEKLYSEFLSDTDALLDCSEEADQSTLVPEPSFVDPDGNDLTLCDTKWVDELQRQMCMHVQLTCQGFLQTYSHPKYWKQAATYEGFINDLSSSQWAQNYTVPAASLISQWKHDVDGSHNGLDKYVEALKYQSRRQKVLYASSRATALPINVRLMDTMLKHGSVFRSIELLPQVPFCVTHDSLCRKQKFLSSEDVLIATYLDKLAFNDLKDVSVAQISIKIAKEMKTYKPMSIYRRILTCIKEMKNHPIQEYIETGKRPAASEAVTNIDVSNTWPIYWRLQDIPSHMKLWIERAKELNGPYYESWDNIYKKRRQGRTTSIKLKESPKEEKPILIVHPVVQDNNVTRLNLTWAPDNHITSTSDSPTSPSKYSTSTKNTRTIESCHTSTPKSSTSKQPTLFSFYKSTRKKKHQNFAKAVQNLSDIFFNYRKKNKRYTVENIEKVKRHLCAFIAYSEFLRDLKAMASQASGKRGRHADDVTSKRLREMNGGVSLYAGSGEEAAKRWTKTSLKTNEQIKMLLSPETVEESAERDAAFAHSYMEKVVEILQAEGQDGKIEEFIDALQEFNVATVNVPNLYGKMERIFLPDHPELLETFLMFLLPGQAAQVGKFFEHFMLTNMATFFNKLNVFYSKYPTQLRKIYSCLNELSSTPNVTMEAIKLKVLPLLKGNQLLIDWFLQCFEGERNFQTPTIPTDIEKTNLIKTNENLNSLEVAEQIPIRLIDTDPNAASCPIRYMAGRIYCGSQIIIPAKLTFVALKALDQYQAIVNEETNEQKQSPTACSIHKNYDAKITPPDFSQTICDEDELQMHAVRLNPDSCEPAPSSPKKTPNRTAAVVKNPKKSSSPRKSPKSPVSSRTNGVASLSSPILEKAKKLKSLTDGGDEDTKKLRRSATRKEGSAKKSIDTGHPIKDNVPEQIVNECCEDVVDVIEDETPVKCPDEDSESDANNTTVVSVHDESKPLTSDTDNVALPKVSDTEVEWTWQEDEQILLEADKNEEASEAEILEVLKSLLVNRTGEQIIKRFRFLMDVATKLRTQ